MHLSIPLFNFTQWKDKCTSYSFTTKKLTHSMCQVSLVVKYICSFRRISNSDRVQSEKKRGYPENSGKIEYLFHALSYFYQNFTS